MTKKKGIQDTEARLGEFLKKWERKLMHGVCIKGINRQLISEEDTFLWSSREDLKAESESETRAARDQALLTKEHAINILKTQKQAANAD